MAAFAWSVSYPEYVPLATKLVRVASRSAPPNAWMYFAKI